MHPVFATSAFFEEAFRDHERIFQSLQMKGGITGLMNGKTLSHAKEKTF
jgi:hypothetical protein